MLFTAEPSLQCSCMHPWIPDHQEQVLWSLSPPRAHLNSPHQQALKKAWLCQMSPDSCFGNSEHFALHTLGCTIFAIYRIKIRLKNVGGAPIFSTLFVTKEMRRVHKRRQHSPRDERQGLSAQTWSVVKSGGQRLLPVFSPHPASHHPDSLGKSAQLPASLYPHRPCFS